MHIDLTGIVTPLATPFAKGGESIDTAAFRKLIDAVIGSGVKAIIANAATSQFSALDDKERELAAEIAVDQAAGRVPVLIGAGASSTRGAIQWARHAQSLGAAGVLIMPPFYGPTPADISVRHFAAISDACPIPIMVYNAPYASHFMLLPEHIVQIVQKANVRRCRPTRIPVVLPGRRRLGRRPLEHDSGNRA